MEDLSIVVVIITHNDGKDLDKTIASVEAQDFPQENIWTYIVDFSSEDGTYEKILSYKPYHKAVFQIPDVYNERARVSRAINIVNSQRPPSVFGHVILLRPGDTVYPSCFSICADGLKKYRAQGTSLLVCEADVIDESGNIMKQPKISNEKLMVNLYPNENLCLGNFFDHYVGYFGGNIWGGYNASKGNERRFWNKIYYGIAHEGTFIYLPQTLFCLKEQVYQDEVGELMAIWAGMIGELRTAKDVTGHEVRVDPAEVNRNFANYGLWRLSKRYSALSQKEREDLLYLAGIINPEIEKEKIYTEFKEKVEKGKEIVFSDYQHFFEEEHRKGQKKVCKAISEGTLSVI